MSKRRMIVGGNWKMFKTPSEAISTAKALKVKVINVQDVEIVICPPFPDLVPVHEMIKGSNIKLGGQNLYWEDQGAFTGEVSARMLKDAGCDYVIVGHSERRHVFGEQNHEINKKVRKALAEGLTPIFCVGEKIDERKSGLTEKIVEEQMRTGLAEVSLSAAEDLVVAYEPVWAIGTGENATPDQAAEVHAFVRRILGELFGEELSITIRIQYGGSVKPANADQLMSQNNIDGALVGGASLDAESFAAIIKSAENVAR
ncbi:triose-phosphate isomerase [candidate division KSB1 bacterium]|nr:triose-phosphate isomerase [candidate division KSB1 bacterium]NIR71496.1 triose-phosphate isomerase [candidate division KSB1 bacterium]NIS23417.1 triose-phosphate isomerase [candidate division KSB1 bacterium]NIT70308.1 triose-phosphate isomerase [candidate division KSB1 bacterium]NIU24031.1 triose-phosphate isomerase [candidate division KSB1 bacterium]